MALTPIQKKRLAALFDESKSTSRSNESGLLGSTVGQFIDSAGTTIGSIPKSLGVIAEKTEQAITGEKADVNDSFLYSLGEGIEEGIGSLGPDVNPEYSDHMAVKIGGGLGSFAGNLATAAIPGGLVAKTATAAGVGAAQTGMEGFEDATRHGTDFDTAFKSFAINAGFGTSEALPISRLFGRLDKASGGAVTKGVKQYVKKHGKEGLKGAGEEALQEIFQNSMGNLTASDLVAYDQDRGFWTGTADAGTVGGSVGFIANTLASMIGGRRVGKITQAVAETDGQTKYNPETNPVTGNPFQNKDLEEINKILSRSANALETNPEGSEFDTRTIKDNVARLKSLLDSKDGNGDSTLDPVQQSEVKDLINTYSKYVGETVTPAQGTMGPTQEGQQLDLDLQEPPAPFELEPPPSDPTPPPSEVVPPPAFELTPPPSEDPTQGELDLQLPPEPTAEQTLDQIEEEQVTEAQVKNLEKKVEELQATTEPESPVIEDDEVVSLDDDFGAMAAEAEQRVKDEEPEVADEPIPEDIEPEVQAGLMKVKTEDEITDEQASQLMAKIAEVSKEKTERPPEPVAKVEKEVEAAKAEAIIEQKLKEQGEALAQKEEKSQTLQQAEPDTTPKVEEEQDVQKANAEPTISPEEAVAQVEAASREDLLGLVARAGMKGFTKTSTKEDLLGTLRLEAKNNPKIRKLLEDPKAYITKRGQVRTEKPVDTKARGKAEATAKGKARVVGQKKALEDLAKSSIVTRIRKEFKGLAPRGYTKLDKEALIALYKDLAAGVDVKAKADEAIKAKKQKATAKRRDEEAIQELKAQGFSRAEAIEILDNDITSTAGLEAHMDAQAEAEAEAELEARANAQGKVKQTKEEAKALEDEVLAIEKELRDDPYIDDFEDSGMGYDFGDGFTTYDEERRSNPDTPVSTRVSKVFNAEDVFVDGFFFPSDGRPFSKQIAKNLKLAERAFNEMINSIKNKKALGDLEFRFVRIMDNLAPNARQKYADAANPLDLKWRGLHSHNRTTGKTTIYLNPYVLMNDSRYFENALELQKKAKEIVLHEVVGHFGLRRLFKSMGVSSYESFLSRIIMTNKDARNKAAALAHRWSNVQSKNSKKDLLDVEAYGHKFKMPKDQLMRLMDEYLAEQATLFVDKDIVGHWGSDQGIIKRFMTLVKHLFRKVFKGLSNKVTDNDIMAMVADSYFNLYGHGSAADKTRSIIGDKRVIKPNSLGNLAEISEVDFFSQLEVADPPPYNPSTTGTTAIHDVLGEAIAATYDTGTPTTQMNQTQALIDEGFGGIRRNAVYNFFAEQWLNFKDKYPKLYTTFNAEGTLRNSFQKSVERRRALGKIGEAERKSKKAFKLFKKLNQRQKAMIMEWMESDEININSYPELSQEVKDGMIEYKETLIEFGDRLVKLGLLKPARHLKHRGKYLPRRFLSHMRRSTGSGMKASPLDYLKARDPEMGEVEQTLAGRIQDPAFIVPEALGIIGRDVALLEYQRTIRDLSKEKDLGWILHNKDTIKTRNGKKLNLVQAELQLERYEKILDDYAAGNETYQNTPLDAVEINKQKDFLQAQVDLHHREFDHKIKVAAGLPLDQPLPTSIKAEGFSGTYKKLPRDFGYGSLSNQWVRKEIYDELMETQAFADEGSALSRAMAPGGAVDRANQHWKQMKVPFNLPSWFRNGFGNGVLLDISTSTNIGKLTKMLAEEAANAIKGQPSKFWEWAHKNGLFGTTFSSSEIYLLNQAHTAHQRAKILRELNKAGTAKSGFLKFQEIYAIVGETMSNGYGNLEGWFKTVAMRDYIQRWEAENNAKIDKLTSPQRNAVINKAVAHANDAIFDYNELTAWQKDLRRSALGAPFLTYTMKAGPAVARGFARNPQKFIKYMMLPYVLSQIAMSAMGDLSEDEIDEWTRNQPKWMKEASSIYVLPWKDENGNLVPMNFGFYFPWAPWQDLAMKGYGEFEKAETAGEYLTGAFAAGAGGLKSLGLLGGPLPTTITAFLANEEPFLGRNIIEPADTAGTKVAKMYNWLWTLWMPPWLTNQGVAGKLLDHYDLDMLGLPSTVDNKDGTPKETMAQTLVRSVGVSTFATSLSSAREKKKQEFERNIRELKTAKASFAKDRRNFGPDRAAKLADFNRRIRLEYRKFRER